MILETLSPDSIMQPFVPESETSDNIASEAGRAGVYQCSLIEEWLTFSWRRVGRIIAFSGTGPPIAWQESFALCDETQYQEIKKQQRHEPGSLVVETGSIAFYVSFALRDKTQYQKTEDPLTSLRKAAERDDEGLFARIVETVDWSHRSVSDFVEAVRLALKAGAHLAARNLATLGAQRYPHNAYLQKMGALLSPPRVRKTNLPTVSDWKANREWIQAHAAEYQGQWVALREGKLIASASTARELKAKVENLKDFLVTKIV